jgi:hypothetical protein
VVPPDVPVIQPGCSDSTEAGVALVEVGSLTEDVTTTMTASNPWASGSSTMKSTKTVDSRRQSTSTRLQDSKIPELIPD